MSTSATGYDLSKDKFYSKWPDWVRWILFLPCSILGCVILSTLFNIIVALFISDAASGSLSHGWYNLISSAILGSAFIGISAYIAPKKQLEVAVSCLVILSIILTAIAIRGYDIGLYKETKDLLYYLLHFLVSTIAALVTVFAIKQEIDSNKPSQITQQDSESLKHGSVGMEDDELEDWEVVKNKEE